jgi:hypothetical protein
MWCMNSTLLSKATNFERVSRYADVTAYSLDGSGSIKRGYWLDGRGSLLKRVNFISSPKLTDQLWGSTSSTSVEIWNGGEVFQAWRLIKRRENFMF